MKLISPQIAKIFFDLYGIWRLITMLISDCQIVKLIEVILIEITGLWNVMSCTKSLDVYIQSAFQRWTTFYPQNKAVHIPANYFLNIEFNITFPAKPLFLKWSPAFRFVHHNMINIFSPFNTLYWACFSRNYAELGFTQVCKHVTARGWDIVLCQRYMDVTSEIHFFVKNFHLILMYNFDM